MNKAHPVSICPGCGKEVHCGIAAGEKDCWCMESPVQLPVPAKDAQCYCPDCLKKFPAK